MRSLIKIKWVLVILAVTTIAWACASSKTQGMSTRQQILKSVYPVLTGVTRFFGVNSRSLPAQQAVSPNVPVYDISFELIDGTPASLAAYKGKKLWW
jgi:uncharacterized lipoprotein YajG